MTKKLTIAFIKPNISSNIASILYQGLKESCEQLDMNLLCFFGKRLNDPQVPDHVMSNRVYDLIHEKTVDAVVIWPTILAYDTANPEEINYYQRFKVPVVTINTVVDDAWSVVLDNRSSQRQLTLHLLEHHGLKKIGFMQGVTNHYSITERLDEHLKVLDASNIAFDQRLLSGNYRMTTEGGMEVFKEFFIDRRLIPGKDIEAIVCANDAMAFGLMTEMQRHGIRVPQDVAIVSVDNKSLEVKFSPSLTTLDPNFHYFGYKAGEILHSVLHGLPCERKTSISGKLIVRKSCGCLETDAVQDTPVQHASDDHLQTGDKSSQVIQELLKGPDVVCTNNMLDCFMADLRNNTETFLFEFGRCLELARLKLSNMKQFEDLVTFMRASLIGCIPDRNQFIKAENLWHKARILIHDASIGEFNTLNMQHFTITYRIMSVVRMFGPETGLENIKHAIFERFPFIGISACYLVLCRDHQQPLGDVSLVFGFDERGLVHGNFEHELYPARQILPLNFLESYKRHEHVICAMYFQGSFIGYAVFKGNLSDTIYYETIAGFLGSAIYGSLLIQNLTSSEAEREKLLVDLWDSNQKLTVAIEQARQASEAKSRFLANISHEIRTPLNGIIGFAEIMENDHGSGAAVSPRYILNESERLLSLINDLLDISKIEAGKFELVREIFNIHDLLESLRVLFAVQANNKGLSFTVQYSEDLPRYLIGDPLRLRQVFVNLIGNAVKFTNEGSVRVLLRFQLMPENNLLLSVDIVDTGVGIPEESLDKIFDQFYQAEESTTRRFGGSGLGTAISRELVQLMGGTIGVESEYGKGTRFMFTVHLLCAESGRESLGISQAGEAEPVDSYMTMKVLVVDDSTVNQMVALNHLKSIGCQTELVVNGLQAVEAFETGSYDLILMDVNMPVMDGYEATRCIRTLPGGEAVSILGITANAFAEDIEKCIDSGMDGVLTKPFRRETFCHAVRNWLDRHREGLKAMPAAFYKKQTNPPMMLSRLLEEFEGDLNMIESLACELVRSSREHVVAMEQAMAVADFQALGNAAHAIKGIALSLFAKPLASLSLVVEKSAAKHDAHATEVHVRLVQDELGRLEDFVGKDLRSLRLAET